ncbi:hypothetical protein LI063_07945 [Clostridium perfringens]|nr:hypothetical protein [Clostridium perfringens]MCX0364084.1 hypothetical protein [Clostridium perfringens]WDT39927.1 hypothetical protein PVA22_02115 [Clostridium perfringens]
MNFKKMDLKKMKDIIICMQEQNYNNFIKALISAEKGIADEKMLEKLYEAYMDNDNMMLLDEKFDYLIDKM